MIFIAWFIWNKTIFGKHVRRRRNAEAASVSGISPSSKSDRLSSSGGYLTNREHSLSVRANASAGTGQGYELDAIAACVVGVIIFTGLTYCLTFLGIDTTCSSSSRVHHHRRCTGREIPEEISVNASRFITGRLRAGNLWRSLFSGVLIFHCFSCLATSLKLMNKFNRPHPFNPYPDKGDLVSKTVDIMVWTSIR